MAHFRFLRAGVGWFHFNMHKYCLVPPAVCMCAAEEQSLDNIVLHCFLVKHTLWRFKIMKRKTGCSRDAGEI